MLPLTPPTALWNSDLPHMHMPITTYASHAHPARTSTSTAYHAAPIRRRTTPVMFCSLADWPKQSYSFVVAMYLSLQPRVNSEAAITGSRLERTTTGMVAGSVWVLV